VACLGAALLVTVGLAAPASASAPTVSLSTDTLVPGQSVTVEGAGWAQGTAFQAVLCGSDATAGSNDCAVQAASTFVPFDDGTLHGVLQVVVPPVPCPCVVQVSATAGGFTTTVPVTVVGAPSAPVSPTPTVPVGRGLTADATVMTATTPGALVGGAAPRTLVVTLHNAGGSPIRTLITARWGSSTSPTHVISSPSPVSVPAGGTRVVSMPFTLDPLTMGTLHVAGEVTGTDPELAFTTTTSNWPWGIPVTIVVVVGLVLFRRWWKRRRAEERAEEAVEAGRATGLGALAVMSVAGAVGADDRTDGDALRLTGVRLTEQLDDGLRSVPVAELTIGRHGIAVTSPDAAEPGVLAWSWIRRLRVVADGRATGAVVVVDTVHTTYRIECPGADPVELSSRVDEVGRRWLTPPRPVPALVG
jgi:hypothetical protein